MFIGKSFRKNRWQRILFTVITALIAIGLVVPIASLFQRQPTDNYSQTDAERLEQNMQAWITDLEGQAEANPQDTAVLMELGTAYISANNLTQAVETFERVLALEPNNVTARYQIALSYYYSSDYDRSIEQLEDLISLEPDNAEVHQLYGYVLYGKEDYAAAVRELELYVALAEPGSSVERARQLIEEWKAL